MNAVDPDAQRVLDDEVRAVTEAAGDRLVAVYALGSLAHGGFRPLVSDVDVAVILSDPIREEDAAMIAAATETVRGGKTALHQRISVFWGTVSSFTGGTDGRIGRFPPLDRLCLFEHGRLLAGTDVRDRLTPPGRADLVAEGARFALTMLADNAVTVAADPAALLEHGVRPTTKMVLFPVRFLLTADTGREGTNDAAVRHYGEHHDGPARDLVRAAFTWRSAEPDPDAARAALRAGFAALYDGFLGEYAARLTEIGEPELVERFAGWRERLRTADLAARR